MRTKQKYEMEGVVNYENNKMCMFCGCLETQVSVYDVPGGAGVFRDLSV